MRHFLIVLILLSVAACTRGNSLPDGYHLAKRPGSGYAILNKEDSEVISAGVVAIGYNERFIVACVHRPAPFVDPKRMVFIELGKGTAVDTVGAEQWQFFGQRIPELLKIKLRPVDDVVCP